MPLQRMQLEDVVKPDTDLNICKEEICLEGLSCLKNAGMKGLITGDTLLGVLRNTGAGDLSIR
jgi:hypothetical protein